MKKDEKILHEMYRRSFAASTPKGDWDELLANATTNEQGEKEIPFMDYECEMEVLQQIFNDVLKENRVPKRRHRQFEMAFWLGCGPKTKITRDE
jgi:hypothetical protein